MHPAVGIAIAYLLGSIPAAYIAGKLTRGIDLRQHGSGNLGATNAYRVLGARVASVVMAFDAAKGAIPVLLFPRWIHTSQPDLWAMAFGVAAIVGHVRPIFLLWKGGGKGVATASGVFLGLAWLPTLLAFVVWLAVILRWGYVSLASLFAAVVLPVALIFTEGVRSPHFIVAASVGVFVFWSHRANIGRLRRGEEHRFGAKRQPEEQHPGAGWEPPPPPASAQRDAKGSQP
jgi:acyl phosphate:glycerol-3-phosphate acyltransferase